MTRRIHSAACMATIIVTFVGVAHAQAQTVQGEATVTLEAPPPPGQVVQPPPGYGQAYQQPQPYAQPQPYYAQPNVQQPQYVERSVGITPLWVTGVIALPLSWVLTWSAAVATIGCVSGPECRDIDYMVWSWVPLVGPWFMLGENDHPNRGLNAGEVAGAVFAGIAQLGSLTMIILGATLRQTVREPAYALGDSEQAPTLAFGLAPAEGGGQLTATLTHF